MGINLTKRKCSGCQEDIDLFKDTYNIKKTNKWFKILFPVIFNEAVIDDKIYCGSCIRENKLKEILLD